MKRNAVRKNTPSNNSTKAIVNSTDILASLDNKKLISILAVFTFIVYLPSLFNDFVLNWDDQNYIMLNPFIQDFSLQTILNVFSNFWKGNYFPVTSIVYAVFYNFFGANPFVFHLLNVIIHIFSIIVLFKISLNLLNRKDGAAIVAILFGIHPFQVESVAWIAELKNVLYGLFFLLSILYYLKFHEDQKKSRKLLAVSFLFFVIATLSKAVAVTLPLALITIDIFKGRKLSIKLFTEKSHYFLVSLIIGIVAILAQKDASAVQSFAGEFNFFHRIVFICYELAFYFIKVLFPVNLSGFHYYPAGAANIELSYYISPLLIALIIYSYVKLKPLRKELMFGFLFFITTVFVMLQIITVGGHIVAERFVYISYIGLFFILAAFFCKLQDGEWPSLKKYRRIFSISFLAFIIVCGILSFNRNFVWKNAITLFDDIIKKYPGRDMAYNYRGVAKALTTNDYTGCINDQDIALSINPKYAEAYYARGLSKQMLKYKDGAFDDFIKAIEIKKNYPDAYNNIGSILLERKKPSEAIIYFNKAIENDPLHAKAFYNKGAAYYYLKNKDEACKMWKHAQELGNKSAIETLKKHCN